MLLLLQFLSCYVFLLTYSSVFFLLNNIYSCPLNSEVLSVKHDRSRFTFAFLVGQIIIIIFSHVL